MLRPDFAMQPRGGSVPAMRIHAPCLAILISFVVASTLASPPITSADAAPPPGPLFAGAGTTVAVNRADGRLAVLHGDRLDIYASGETRTPTTTVGIPGRAPLVREFRGNTLLYETHEVRGLATAYVALSADGRERLAWPNAGLSELFPAETTELTLDGRGVFDNLTLAARVRDYFELPASIPDGAGVVATFRFAGEKMAARGSETFASGTALGPDDLLITLKPGGVMRYRAPGGVVWKHEAAGGTWRVADAQGAGLAIVIDGEGSVLALDLDTGKERLRWGPERQASAVAGWLGQRSGAEGPGAAPRVLDVRRLHSAMLLVLGEAGGKWLGIVDPSDGKPVDGEILSRLREAGLDAVVTFWSAHSDSLAQTWELPSESGSTLLMRGADGWYEVRLR